MEYKNYREEEEEVYRAGDTQQEGEVRTFEQINHTDGNSVSSNANTTYQKEKLTGLNALNNFSGIMQNFTIDSDGMHHYKSSAHLDTQEIESRFLGEESQLNARRAQDRHHEGKLSSIDVYDPAQQLNASKLVAPELRDGGGNNTTLDLTLLDGPSTNQPTKRSERTLNMGDNHQKNSSSFMDNSLSTSINTYIRGKPTFLGNDQLAANRLMMQFKNQGGILTTVLSETGGNGHSEHKDESYTIEQLDRQTRDTFGNQFLPAEDMKATHGLPAGRSEPVSHGGTTHNVTNVFSDNMKASQSFYSRSFNNSRGNPDQNSVSAPIGYQGFVLQNNCSSGSLKNSVRTGFLGTNEPSVRTSDGERKAEHAPDTNMLIEEYAPYQSRQETVGGKPGAMGAYHSYNSSGWQARSSQQQTLTYGDGTLRMQQQTFSQNEAKAVALRPKDPTCTTKESTLVPFTNRQNDQILKKIENSNEFLGHKAEYRGSHCSINGAITQSQVLNNKDLSRRSIVHIDPSSSQSAFGSQRHVEYDASRGVTQREQLEKPVAPQIIIINKEAEFWAKGQTPLQEESLYHTHGVQGKRSATTPAYRSGQLESFQGDAQRQMGSLSKSIPPVDTRLHSHIVSSKRKIDYDSMNHGHELANFQSYDNRNAADLRSFSDPRNPDDIPDIMQQKSADQNQRKVINGNQVIRVNASDPASIINSGRKGVSEQSPLSGLNNRLETHQSHAPPRDVSNGEGTSAQSSNNAGYLQARPNMALREENQNSSQAAHRMDEQSLVNLLEKSHLSTGAHSHNQNHGFIDRQRYARGTESHEDQNPAYERYESAHTFNNNDQATNHQLDRSGDREESSQEHSAELAYRREEARGHTYQYGEQQYQTEYMFNPMQMQSRQIYDQRSLGASGPVQGVHEHLVQRFNVNSSLANSSVGLQSNIGGNREHPATQVMSPMLYTQPQSFSYTQTLHNAVHDVSQLSASQNQPVQRLNDHERPSQGSQEQTLYHAGPVLRQKDLISIDYGSSENHSQHEVLRLNKQQYLRDRTTLSFAPNSNTQLTKRDSVERIDQQQFSARIFHPLPKQVQVTDQFEGQQQDQDVTQDEELAHEIQNVERHDRGFTSKPPLVGARPTGAVQTLAESRQQVAALKNHFRNNSEYLRSQEEHEIAHSQSFFSGTGQGTAFGQTGGLPHVGERSNLAASRSFSQDQFKTQTNARLGHLAYMDHDVTSNTHSNNTSALAAPHRSGGNSTSKTPVLVEILKQELLSCKRQLKDQQSSNAFIKKEKFKLEHEQNLMEIQLNQGVDKMENVLQEYEHLQAQSEVERKHFNEERELKDGYIEKLEATNVHLDRQNVELAEELEMIRNQFSTTINEQNIKKQKSDNLKLRNQEKIVSELLQLSSVASHLKDMVRLGKINDKALAQQNDQKIVAYMEDNLETLIHSALHHLGAKNFLGSSLETTEEKTPNSNDDLFLAEKLKVRAQNFKKFRQSTTQLIQKLFDNQLHAKKLIINDLESLVIKEQDDHKHLVTQKTLETQRLHAEVAQQKKKAEEANQELEKLRAETVPQIYTLQEKLRVQESQFKTKFSREYLKKEEGLTSKMIKQKYQLQEEEEKCKMLQKQNTELKIANEGLRFQLGNHSAAVDMMASQNRAANIGRQLQRQQDADVMAQSEPEQLVAQRLKNKKLKEVLEKKDYFHEQEKILLKRQITEYRDTVETQSLLIQELQRKISIPSNSKTASYASLHYHPQQPQTLSTHPGMSPGKAYMNQRMSTHPGQINDANMAPYGGQLIVLDQENSSQLSNNQQYQQMYAQQQQMAQPQRHHEHKLYNSSFMPDPRQYEDQGLMRDGGHQSSSELAHMSQRTEQEQHDQVSYLNSMRTAIPVASSVYTGELEPIYEDQSKGEQSTGREQYQDGYQPHDQDDTASHSHGNTYRHEGMQIPDEAYLLSQYQHRPAMSEIQKVYQTVNSTINNLINANFQRGASACRQEQIHREIDELLDPEEQALLQNRSGAHGPLGQLLTDGGEDDSEDEDPESCADEQQDLTSPPRLTDQKTATLPNNRTSEEHAGFANKYANLENFNAQLFKSLETDSQHNTLNQESIKQSQEEQQVVPERQHAYLFQRLSNQDINGTLTEQPTPNRPLASENPYKKAEKPGFNDTVSQLQAKINALESRLSVKKEFTRMDSQPSPVTVVRQQTETAGEHEDTPVGLAQHSSSVNTLMDQTTLTNQHLEVPCIQLEAARMSAAVVPGQGLDITSDNSQDSFNMNTLPLQNDDSSRRQSEGPERSSAPSKRKMSAQK